MDLLRRAVGLLLIAVPTLTHSQSFVAVTIRPAGSQRGNGRVELLADRTVVARSAPVITLLSYAYDLPVNGSRQLTVLPDWTVRERYDIEVRSAIAAGLSDSEVRDRMKTVVRELLAERFKLVMQVEEVIMPVYALTVTSGGVRIERSEWSEHDCISNPAADCHSFSGGLGHPLNGTAIDMDDVAHYISNWTDRPVVNQTKVEGLFRVHTEGWVPMRLPPPPPNGVVATNPFAGLPSLSAVLGELGLELRRQEERLPVYTVDRIDGRRQTDHVVPTTW